MPHFFFAPVFLLTGFHTWDVLSHACPCICNSWEFSLTYVLFREAFSDLQLYKPSLVPVIQFSAILYFSLSVVCTYNYSVIYYLFEVCPLLIYKSSQDRGHVYVVIIVSAIAGAMPDIMMVYNKCMMIKWLIIYRAQIPTSVSNETLWGAHFKF